jgi:hypothetical protein
MSIIRNHGLPAYSSQVLEANAKGRHPECNHARTVNGLTACFEIVEVVQMWETIDDAIEQCRPKYELSYSVENR